MVSLGWVGLGMGLGYGQQPYNIQVETELGEM